MHHSRRLLITSTIVLSLLAQGHAQSSPNTATPANTTVPAVSFDVSAVPVIPPALQAMLTAQDIRNGIVTSIASGAITPEVGLVRLKATASAVGLGIDADAEQGYAAVEIGLHLLSLNKAAEAGKFFQQAELSLALVINRTPDKNVQDKVQFLAKRAFIRAKFLNKGALAKADLAAAQLLNPGDTNLQLLRNHLGNERAADITVTPQG